ncbi:MAG: type II toxin-antitoxin system HicB family antitoxin [Proteobacteria bacterium]|nr:type II toxin-antitoxin system HicB family antitoxin [Pseudomonadota bacterium]
MRYPIAIEKGDKKHAFGVVVPDLPGCFSAGDTMDEAIDNSIEAIELWLETTLEDGGSIPDSSAIEKWQKDPEYSGWIWAIVGVDLAKLSSISKRINITVPERVLSLIDKAATRQGESRSGFLVRAALDAIEHGTVVK